MEVRIVNLTTGQMKEVSIHQYNEDSMDTALEVLVDTIRSWGYNDPRKAMERTIISGASLEFVYQLNERLN